MDLKIWIPLAHISESILDKVRVAYVFGSQGHEALLITEDDEFLICGSKESLSDQNDRKPAPSWAFSSNQKVEKTAPSRMSFSNQKVENTALSLRSSYSRNVEYTAPSLPSFSIQKVENTAPSLTSTSVLHPKSFGVEKLVDVEGIPKFSSGSGPKGTFVVVCTNMGHIYSWGGNIGCTNSSSPFVLEPTLVKDNYAKENTLLSVRFCEVACGTNHCLALDEDGKVYSWGFNEAGQLGNGYDTYYSYPILIKCFEKQKVTKISCGDNFSVVLLDDGKVFAWGDNKDGQLCLSTDTTHSCSPVQINGLGGDVIKDFACGKAHVLAVTNVGVIYGWGKNTRGELGLGDTNSHSFPEMISTDIKFVDIAAVNKCSISAAMSDKSEVFMWGDFSDFYYSTPVKVPHKSLQEVFAYFATPRIMHKPMIRQLRTISATVIPEKQFQDKETSDLIIIAEGKQIFVHREILTTKSNYFRVFLQEHWVKKNLKFIHMDEKYEAIRAYLQYIYTGEIKATPDIALELLSLASKFKDETFKKLCDECLQFDIGIENVASSFAVALKLNAPKLLEDCVTYAGLHLSEVLLTPAVSEWDKDTIKEFMMQCHKKKLFRS